MAKAKGRKLKVFQASFGFNDSVIAVPSQAAALRAWGSHQNLFAQGFAKPATDEGAIQAALANPETPLFRAVGSNDPFELKARSLPKIQDLPKWRKKAPAKTAEPKKEEPPPDRTALDEAEKALKALQQSRAKEEAEFSRRWDELHREQNQARQAFLKAQKDAETTIKEAKIAYRRAGGSD